MFESLEAVENDLWRSMACHNSKDSVSGLVWWLHFMLINLLINPFLETLAGCYFISNLLLAVLVTFTNL